LSRKATSPGKRPGNGIGSKGLIVGQDKLPWVWEAMDRLPGKQVWLYAKKMKDGGTRYAISNAHEDTPLEKFRELSPGRWSIEQCFEECKSNLGLGHFEGRSWKGWHRHVMLVFALHLFLQLF
jgi:SRSO17 transposase